METVQLYRKRLIPNECILLKDDIILFQDEHHIVTKWNTLKPKHNLDHGVSCYFLDYGVKVSKFYNQQNEMLSWYCDIIDFVYDAKDNSYCFTDLLADVIVYPDGFVKVVDLDELADANEEGLLSIEQLNLSLRHLSKLLEKIYKGKFHTYTDYLESFEKN